MDDMLKLLAHEAAVRVARDKEKTRLDTLKKRMENGEIPVREAFCFEKAIARESLSFVCEVKRASPSKGIIAQDFPYLEIAKEYEAAGVDCISCLTEPKWFLGSDDIFCDIRSAVALPMIRKDFTVDEYQIYQARTMGADAVLLICAILSERQLGDYLALCDGLGLSALVETHDEREMEKAVGAGARLIGVNNRNLKDFSVDMDNSCRLRAIAPKNALFVSESGIRSAADIPPLIQAGVDAVLIGEAFMRSDDKTGFLRELKAAQ